MFGMVTICIGHAFSSLSSVQGFDEAYLSVPTSSTVSGRSHHSHGSHSEHSQRSTFTAVAIQPRVGERTAAHLQAPQTGTITARSITSGGEGSAYISDEGQSQR